MYQITLNTPSFGKRVIHKDIDSYALAAYMVRGFVKEYKKESDHGKKGDNFYKKGRAVCYKGGDRHEFTIEKK